MKFAVKKTTKLYIVIAILGAVLVSLIIRDFWDFAVNQEPINDLQSTSSEEERSAHELLEKPVQVEIVRRGDIVHSISSNGSAKLLREAEIKTNVSGRVVQLNVQEGDYVETGAVLFTIDDEVFKIAYKEKKEEMNRALNEYAKELLAGEEYTGSKSNRTTVRSRFYDDLKAMQETVSDENILQMIEWLRANPREKILATTSGLNASRLALQKANIDLKNTIVRTPMDGFIAELDVKTHKIVKAEEVVMKVVSLDALIVEVGILESEIQYVTKGARVIVDPPSLSGSIFSGIVRTISPVIDAESRTCNVEIEVMNPKHLIKPGMFVNVSISKETFQQRLLIPRDALLIRDGRKMVFVYSNGRARWHYVQTGLENDSFIEVTDGLSESDSLIVSGHFQLAHDARVKLIH